MPHDSLAGSLDNEVSTFSVDTDFRGFQKGSIGIRSAYLRTVGYSAYDFGNGLEGWIGRR